MYDSVRKLYSLADGQLMVWYDGCVCIKIRPHGPDPIELADEEAIEIADILLHLSGDDRAPKEMEIHKDKL